MKILVTRPIKQSEELAGQLVKLGYEPIICPLLEIIHKDIELDFRQLDALIITSRNALDAITKADKNIKLLIVGQRTTDIAKSMGFVDVVYAGKNISELKEKLGAYNRSKLLYISGEEITEELDVERVIAYSAEKVKEVPDLFIDFMQLKEKKISLFFSSRSAEIFSNFVNKYSFNSYCCDIIAITLSKKIANNLQEINFNACYIADEPTVDSVLMRITNNAK